MTLNQVWLLYQVSLNQVVLTFIIFLVNVGNEEDDRERVRKVNKTKQINIQS